MGERDLKIARIDGGAECVVRSREIQDRVHDMLPDPIPAASEDNTGAIPVVIE